MGQYINGYYVFSPVTSTDKAGLLWVAAILSLLFAVLTLLTRYHIKRRTFGPDDWLITAATVIALAQYIAVFIGMNDHGLGKSSTLLSLDEATHAGRSVFASNCLFIIALALSKFSVVLFLKRLFTGDFHIAWLACNILLGVVAVWAVVSIMILVIGCGPGTKLLGDRCSGQVLRWGIVAALDSLFELVIIVLSFVFVSPLQMSLSIKLTVVFAFSFRAGVIVFASIHAARVNDYAHSPDAGLSIINNLVWQQIELGYALVSATIPTLKSFISGYEKAMGWELSYMSSDVQAPGMFGTASMQMQTFRSTKNSGNRSTHDADDENDAAAPPKLRPDRHKYRASVYGPDDARRPPSGGSSESQNPIIRKDVRFTVSSETAPTSPMPWARL